MCKLKAKIFCLCNDPHVVMCFNHIRNHTGGRSCHCLKSLQAHEDKLFLTLVKNTIRAIINHLISATFADLKKQGKSYIQKIALETQSKRMQSLKEINVNNQRIRFNNQQFLRYITQCKKIGEQIKADFIENFFSSIMNIFILDTFIKKKLIFVYDAIKKRSLGIRIVLINNSIYQGEIENNLPEGTGVLKYPCGGVYSGEFQYGQPEGRGVLKYCNGAVYEGEFKGGKFEGRGFLKYSDGSVYDGYFQRGEPEGRGVLKRHYR